MHVKLIHTKTTKDFILIPICPHDTFYKQVIRIAEYQTLEELFWNLWV